MKKIYAMPILTGLACAATDQYVSRKFGLIPNSLAAYIAGVGLGSFGMLILNGKDSIKKEYEKITGIQPTERYPMNTIIETIELHKKIRRKDYT